MVDYFLLVAQQEHWPLNNGYTLTICIQRWLLLSSNFETILTNHNKNFNKLFMYIGVHPLLIVNLVHVFIVFFFFFLYVAAMESCYSKFIVLCSVYSFLLHVNVGFKTTWQTNGLIICKNFKASQKLVSLHVLIM